MMPRRLGSMLLWSVALFAGAAGIAKRPSNEPAGSEALRPVLACRNVQADQERLACYDKAAGALGEATAKREIVVVDAQAIATARRSLFGFSTPSLDVFKSDRPDAQEPNEVTSAVRSARRDTDGNWIVALDDGAVWHQTSGIVGGSVRPGEPVVVRRASLGSYFLRIGKRPGVRARREG